MTLRRATKACLATLALGALVTGGAFVQMGGFPALFSGYGLLPLSPYAVFCGACFLAMNSGGAAIATFVVCALATGFAIYFYVDLVFLNPGSMNGLVFYFVPVIQLVVALLLVVAVFFIRLRRRSKAAPNHTLKRTDSAE